MIHVCTTYFLATWKRYEFDFLYNNYHNPDQIKCEDLELG